MGRRKGELTPAGVDRGWPHQVAIPASEVSGGDYQIKRDFCSAHAPSVCPRGHTVVCKGEYWEVFCFADVAHAAAFADEFGGVPFDPWSRGRGKAWSYWKEAPEHWEYAVCNLYSQTKSQDAIRAIVKAMRDKAGNQPPLPEIFPDTIAPVVRKGADGERELLTMRWGFPPPPNAGKRPVTNVRETGSSFWRPWLAAEARCLVPATAFCEWTDQLPKTQYWFALNEERPLFFFAGIWRTWRGTRGTKKDPAEGEHLLFSFLTCQANDIVRPIHEKAMPVILTEPEEFDIWLDAPIDEALLLQRPLPNDKLMIVAKGKQEEAAKDPDQPLLL